MIGLSNAVVAAMLGVPVVIVSEGGVGRPIDEIVLAMVTLRGEKMYEFLDRFISVTLPRVRDFRGVSTKSFDGRGNYTIGLNKDQLIFPEIDYAKVDKQKGMNATIVTTARDDNEARSLLKGLGMPFRTQ